MQEKVITITLDESGNSTLDLEGFTCHICEKVSADFRGEDLVKVDREKPAYYSGQQVQQGKSQH